MSKESKGKIMKIEIIPLKGIKIDDKEINLGCTMDDLKSILGKEEVDENRLYYFESDVAFDFNKKKELEFIEFLGGADSKVEPVIYGLSVFDTQIEELRNVLSIHNGNNIEDDIYYDISIGLYQELTLEDLNDIIEEAKNDGMYEEMKEEIENDLWRANHCTTLGVGFYGYYNN